MKKILLNGLFTLLLSGIGSLSFAQCPIFYDGFESGSFSPTWSVGGSLTSTGVSTTNVAQGDYSLTGTGGVSDHLNGYSTTLPNVTPSEISWYMYTNGAAQSVNYFVVGDQSIAANQNILFCYFRGEDSEIRFVSNPSNYEVQVTPNNWYFIEVKNINWTNKTFDIHIDGVLQISNFPFRTPAMNFISQVHLYNFHNGIGYWDEITFGVPDTEAPVPDQASLSDIEESCEVSAITPPTATDNCAGSINGVPNVSFPITTSTTITWTYDDGNGNVVTQNQEVIIQDTEAPVPDQASLSDIEESCEVLAITPPTATDNCAGSINGVPNVSFPITTSTTITWTYDDGNGNVETQNQEVIIEDTEAPVADQATLSDLEDVCEITTLNAPTATDNCDGSVEGTHNAVFPITENTTITWTYTDIAGNTSTQTQNVVISGVNATVNYNGSTISALNTNSGVTYQWVDCDNGFAVIPNETNVSYTPNQGGNYAVIVSEDGCEETSECVEVHIANVATQNTLPELVVYPNPSDGLFQVKTNLTNSNYSIFDTQGRLVQNGKINNESIFIDLNKEVGGIYFLKVEEFTIKLSLRK